MSLRIRYDPEVDALSISFRETTVMTRELAEGIVAEYDELDQFVGLEILEIGWDLGAASANREISLEGVSLTVSSGERAAKLA